MLRDELEIKGKEEIEPILRQCTTCRIGMIAEGRPYILPMVYGYTWGEEGVLLYFHCGLRGRKNKALRESALVCFELDLEGELMGVGGPAHTHSRAFSCVMGEGTVEFAEGSEEKRRGFDIIMRHQTGRDGWTYPEAYLATAEVFRIRVTRLRASQKRAARPAPQKTQVCDNLPSFDESHGM